LQKAADPSVFRLFYVPHRFYYRLMTHAAVGHGRHVPEVSSIDKRFIDKKSPMPRCGLLTAAKICFVLRHLLKKPGSFLAIKLFFIDKTCVRLTG